MERVGRKLSLLVSLCFAQSSILSYVTVNYKLLQVKILAYFWICS